MNAKTIPNESEHLISTVDGTNLQALCLHAGNTSWGVVLLCPAMGVKATFYRTFAQHLCTQGLDVVLFDYRGMGRSAPASLRDYRATMRDWAEKDIGGVLQWIGDNFSQPIIVIGHSAGGQLAGITGRVDGVAALILVCSQSGYWRHWQGVKRLLMVALWYFFMPSLSIAFGYFPAKRLRLGEDLPKGVAMQWARWCRTQNYIASNPELAERYTHYHGPALAFSFDDDGFAPRPAVDALLDSYVNAQVTHKHVEVKKHNGRQVGHFGFFRKPIGQEFWDEIVTWLRANHCP